MNSTFEEIWTYIIKQKSITIVTHIDPDGDTIGSALALKELILNNSDIKDVKISGVKTPRYLSLIDETENVTDKFFENSQTIVVDTSTISRFGDQRVVTKKSIKIDHHKHEEKWLMEIGGDQWPATGQLIYEMSKSLNLKISKKAALGMWIAIWTDTEGLTQRNVSAITREAITVLGKKNEILPLIQLNETEKQHIEKLRNEIKVDGKLTYLITDDFVSNDYARQMVGDFSNVSKTEVFLSISKSDKNIFRGELRSKGNLDVSILAKKLGGGGHYASSGFKVDSLAKAKKSLVYILKNINKT